jgi:magnesium transporter
LNICPKGIQRRPSKVVALNVRSIQIVESMRPPDDRAELFDELPHRGAKRLVQQLQPRRTTGNQPRFSACRRGTAGRVTNTEYVRLRRTNGSRQRGASSKIRLATEIKTVYRLCNRQ